MPYRIAEELRPSRTFRVLVDSRRGDMDAFVRPIARGEPTMPELLAAIPAPLEIGGTGKGEPTDVFWEPLLTVRSRVRDILEGLEPGAHEFIPLLLRANKDSPDEVVLNDYFFMKTAPGIDCVIVDDDTRFIGGIGRAGFEKNSGFAIDAKPKLDGAAIDGRHLWRGTGRLQYVHFCSDELHERFEAAQIAGIRYTKCRVA